MNDSDEYNKRIVAGAAELFRIYGIKAVTMDTIASHLGMSKRTIYEQFHDKDELLYAVIVSMMKRQKDMTEKILASSPDVIAAIFTMIKMGRNHVETMNPLISSDLKKYHSSVLSRLEANRENPDYDLAQTIIRAGVEQGVFRENLSIDILGRIFSIMGKIIGDTNLFPPEKFIQRDLIRSVILNYLRGISTPKGIARIDAMEIEI